MKSANRIIAVSAIVTMAVTILASVQKKNDLPEPKVWVGYGAAFAITSVFADLGSPLGGGLAALIMVTALANYGADAFGLIATRAGQTGKQTAQPSTPVSGFSLGPASTTSKTTLTTGLGVLSHG